VAKLPSPQHTERPVRHDQPVIRRHPEIVPAGHPADLQPSERGQPAAGVQFREQLGRGHLDRGQLNPLSPAAVSAWASRRVTM